MKTSNTTGSHLSTEKRAFNTHEAAAYIARSPSFLTHGRSEGTLGNRTPTPPFIRYGRSISYLREDLDAWLDQFEKFETVAEADAAQGAGL